MKIYKIELSSWTSSFRYPNLISGVQPTLRVPPLSTVFGIISAAKGDYYQPDKDLKLAYYFEYESIAWDLETIYQIKSQPVNQAKSNIMKREQLIQCRLILYTNSKEISGYLEKPVFALLIGRSSDLASLDRISEIEIEEKEELENVIGTIIPFSQYKIPAPIQALPVLFSEDNPRKNLLTLPFYMLDANNGKGVSIKAKGFRDNSLNNRISHQPVDLYWQDVLTV